MFRPKERVINRETKAEMDLNARTVAELASDHVVVTPVAEVEALPVGHRAVVNLRQRTEGPEVTNNGKTPAKRLSQSRSHRQMSLTSRLRTKIHLKLTNNY